MDTEKYDVAARVLSNKKNNTDAWRLMNEIDDLGEITLESESNISSLKKAYDKLSEDDKKTILNYNVLTSAESRYAELKKKEDARIAEEKKKAEEEKKAAEEKAEAERIAAEEKAEAERLAAEEAEKQREEDAIRDGYTVIITSGEKYHTEGCSYLRKNKWETTQGWAIANGYEPCSRCIYRDFVPSYYYTHD